MNYLLRLILVGIASAGMCSASWAATVVKYRNIQGKTETITIDKQQARIQFNSNHYTLMNLKTGLAYIVEVQKKRIITMKIKGRPPRQPASQSPKSPPWGKTVRAELKYVSLGGTIAGYFTGNYEVKAFGKACSENYLSQSAARVAYLKEFLQAMSDMKNSRKIKGMYFHPCEQAHNELEQQLMRYGISMKSVIKGKNGSQVRHEIISIKTNINISPYTFTLPKYQKRLSEQQWLKEQQAAMKKWMAENPQRGQPKR